MFSFIDNIKEFLHKPVKNEALFDVISIPVVFITIALFVVFCILVFKVGMACNKYAKKNKKDLFSDFNIICYAVFIGGISYKSSIDKFLVNKNKLFSIAFVIILIFCVLFPTIKNLISCKLKYGLGFCLVQLSIGAILGTIIYLAIGFLLFVFAGLFGGGSGDDTSGIWVISSDGKRKRLRQTSGNWYVDSNGNRYERSGDSFYDSKMNRYREC